MSSFSLFSSLDVHVHVYLPCSDQDDLKHCHEEHSNSYFQLLSIDCDVLSCKTHAYVLEVVCDHGPDVI